MLKTRILTLNPDQPELHLIQEAAAAIQRGELVAFPTETVYALGANALDDTAVRRIIEATARTATDPIIVHIADMSDLSRVTVDVPEIAERLASAFWPGPLTLILKKHPDIPLSISAGSDTVAVRMPNHPVTLAWIRAAGVPVGGPSANRFSRPSPTTAAHVLEDLDGRIEFIMDSGPTTIGVESTILDLVSAEPAVLRPGGLPLEALRPYLPEVQFRPHYLDESVETVPAPGTLLKHYSPKAELLLFEGEKAVEIMRSRASDYLKKGQKVGVLALDQQKARFSDLPLETASAGADETAMAQGLFSAMRDLDARGVDVILALAPGKSGLGLAVWDRLVRAAEGKVING